MTVARTVEMGSVLNQYYASIAASLIMLGQGCTEGWVAPAIPILISSNTPLTSGPLTSEQISWLGSLSSIGLLCGSLFFCYLTNVLGPKRAMVFLSVPPATFWLLIYFGDTYYEILLARFFSGMASGGVPVTTLIYLAEISNNEIRGRLSIITSLFRNIGIMMAYTIGATVTYNIIPCICIIIPIFYGIISMTLLNTPQYYLHKGKPLKAENSLKHYKGHKDHKHDNQLIFAEFERLKSISVERKHEEKLQPSDFFNRNAMKRLGTGIAMTILSQFSANFTIISYSVTIFKRAGTSINPNLSSIICSMMLILGSLLSTYLVDILGRKKLSCVSLLGSAIGLFAMSFYYYLYLHGHNLTAYAWIPVASLSFVVVLSSAGIVPLSILCSIEILPKKIRNLGVAIITCSLGFCSFVASKIFPGLLDMVDLHGCFIIYGILSVLGAIFVLFALQETSGKSIDDLETNLKHNAKILSCDKEQQVMIPVEKC